jgi:hypothetical protein
MKNTLFAVLLAVATATLPLAASAQQQYGETIRGTIVSLDGAGTMQLHDDRGFDDNVRLEPNVDVSPSGVQLRPGMRVTISGANAGSVFSAERIAAAAQPAPPQYGGPSYRTAPPPYPDPYAYAYPYPVYAYPYPVYAYPYPVYAYPFGYPRVSIGIGFGSGSHFHGRGFHR